MENESHFVIDRRRRFSTSEKYFLSLVWLENFFVSIKSGISLHIVNEQTHETNSQASKMRILSSFLFCFANYEGVKIQNTFRKLYSSGKGKRAAAVYLFFPVASMPSPNINWFRPKPNQWQQTKNRREYVFVDFFFRSQSLSSIHFVGFGIALMSNANSLCRGNLPESVASLWTFDATINLHFHLAFSWVFVLLLVGLFSVIISVDYEIFLWCFAVWRRLWYCHDTMTIYVHLFLTEIRFSWRKRSLPYN